MNVSRANTRCFRGGAIELTFHLDGGSLGERQVEYDSTTLLSI